MGFISQLCSGLIWKNYLLKRRKLITTLLEIFLPVLIMLMMVAIRLSVSVEEYPQSDYITDTVTLNQQTKLDIINNIMKFEKYVGQIVFIPSKSINPAMALIQQSFIDYNKDLNFKIPQKYGNQQFITGQNYTLADYMIEYDNSDDLDNYIQSAEYSIGNNPKIATAIIINQFGSTDNFNSWSYTIRQNLTLRNNGTSIDTSQQPQIIFNGLMMILIGQ